MSPAGDRDGAGPHCGSAGRDPARVGPPLRLALAAEMAAPSIIRERLDQWLHDLEWPAGQQDDLVLAASEAVSNSVEHGYRVDHSTGGHPGLVRVEATVHADADGYRHIVITVRDQGGWQPPREARGNRQHGLPLMGACVESLDVDGNGDGTTVVLRSRAVPPTPDRA